MNNRLVLGFVLLFLLSSITNAAVFDAEDITFCSDSKSEVLQVRLWRQEAGQSRYEFSTNLGDLRHSAVTLQENQQAFIELQVNPNSLGIGTHTASITASGDTTITTSATISVKVCGDIKLIAPDAQVCSGQENIVELTIENPGDDPVVVELDFSGIFEPTLVTVAPGSSSSVPLRYTPDMKKKTVEVTYTIDGTSRREKFTLTPVSAAKCSGISLQPFKIYLSSAASKATVRVTNVGAQPATYDLAFQGPEWLTLEDDSVTVNANEEATITFGVEPPTGAPQQYEVQLIAKAGEKVYSESFYIDFREPSAVSDFLLKNWPWLIFAIIVIVVILGIVYLQTHHKRLGKPVKLKLEPVVSSGGSWSKKYAKIDFDNLVIEKSYTYEPHTWQEKVTSFSVGLSITFAVSAVILLATKQWVFGWVLLALAVIGGVVFLSARRKSPLDATPVQPHERYWLTHRWLGLAIFTFVVGYFVGSWPRFRWWIVLIIIIILLVVLMVLLMPSSAWKNLDKYFFIERR